MERLPMDLCLCTGGMIVGYEPTSLCGNEKSALHTPNAVCWEGILRLTASPSIYPHVP